MKRILFALQLAMLLLSIPVAMNAEDAQKVFLNSGWLDGSGWYDYKLEMRHKSADNIYSYTFNSGDGSGDTYFRIKIVRGTDVFIIAPSGEDNILLTKETYIEASAAENPMEAINTSYNFIRKANTTYTIRLKWDNFYDGKYNGLKVTFYEGGEAPANTVGYPPRPRLLSTDESFNNKAFTKAGPNYYYCDVDLTGRTTDLDFKFYTITDKEYLGCDYMGFKEINKFTFDNFYWASNELGPNKETSSDSWRNEYFTLKHSESYIKKYRINLWKVGHEEAGGVNSWKFYVQDMGANPNDELYFVSPELTGNKRLPEFRMSPSRQRIDVDKNGKFDEVVTHWSFNLQDFLLDSNHKNLESIRYHIETANGKVYTVHDMNDDYELGFAQETDFYPASDNQGTYLDLPNDYDREQRIIANIGNVARYERYDAMPEATLTAEGEVAHHYLLKRSDIRDKAQNGTSYTWLFNRSTGSLGIYVNKPNFGKEEDAAGYSLLGNFNPSGETYNIEIQKDEYSHKMTKYWYKGGIAHTTEQTEADSIVYTVTVPKPDNGWKKEGYTMVVAPNSVIAESQADGFGDWGGVWAKVIRPQERCDYFYYDETLAAGYNEMSDGQKVTARNELKDRVDGNWTGLNATALHGGLYARKDEQTDNVQQMITVFPKDGVDAFTFSMNLTTSTYRITREENLFIMGPAVGTKDDDRDTYGWSNADAAVQTDHAYKLTYSDALECYQYLDADGKEAPVPMAANRPFAFAVNKSFNKLYFAENGVVPVSLVDASGNSTEATVYNCVVGDENHDTQYVNFLEKGTASSAEYNEAIKACKFMLPSKTGEGEGYYIRLYDNPTGKGRVFYTIRRAYTFSTPQNPKNDVGGYKSFKTFSDYHAVELPEGVKAFYISGADKATRTARLTEYPCRLAYGKYVLPAGAAVILATKDEAAEGTGGILKLGFDMDYFYEPYFNETDWDKAPTDNLLKPQITQTVLPKTADGKDNFLFSFQKKYASDERSTVGFFVAGKAKNPINTAYLQVDGGFLEGSSLSAKGWTLSFDFDDVTGIQDIETETSAASNEYYSLQGIKVSKPVGRGIYICNGRKVIVK